MSSVIEISPLTRVEGHGRISVLRSGKRIAKVTLALYESPRLFESLLKGKGYAEVPEIICRICSLCSTVHRVCSLQAIEKAFQVQVSEQTRLYRELILYGGHIQSHALHLYCLALPDLLQVSGLAGLAQCAPEELKRGLRIKEVGNQIQEAVGGRLIHPVTLIPGGMGKPLDRAGLRELKKKLQEVLPDTLAAVELFATDRIPQPLSAPHYLSVRSGTAASLIGDRIATATGETIPAEAYAELLREQPTPAGNAKRSLAGGRIATVGALARLNLEMPLPPRAAAAFATHRSRLAEGDMRANNLAQAIELVMAAERALEIVETLLERGPVPEPPVRIVPRHVTSSAVIEAPRGLLVHSYAFDSRGVCTAADIITPTAINQAALEADLATLALRMEAADDEQLTLALERLVRAYDPCISCAVHLIRA